MQKPIQLKVTGPQQLALGYDDFAADLDLAALIARDPALAPLKDDSVFNSATLDDTGVIFTHPDDGHEDGPLETVLDFYTLWDMVDAKRPMTGADLKKWREGHALTQDQAAALFDCGRRTYVRYEQAAHTPFPIKITTRFVDDHPALAKGLVPVAAPPGRPTKESA